MEIVEALVQMGSLEVPYVRAGRGRAATLLLGVTTLSELAASREFQGMAAVGRAIGVVPPARYDPGWLRDLIEALGLERPTVVVDPAFAALVEGFASEHPERVGEVRVVADGRRGRG